MNRNHVQESYARLVAALRQDQRSDAEVARVSGVSQPTVWRLRNRNAGRIRASSQFSKLCAFYRLNELEKPPGEGSLEDELKGAIMNIWDGSDAHARALIKVIRSLKGLAQPHQTPEPTTEGGRNAGHAH
ncbi:hypothetical protein D3C84_81600 [compost metagenome]